MPCWRPKASRFIIPLLSRCFLVSGSRAKNSLVVTERGRAKVIVTAGCNICVSIERAEKWGCRTWMPRVRGLIRRFQAFGRLQTPFGAKKLFQRVDSGNLDVRRLPLGKCQFRATLIRITCRERTQTGKVFLPFIFAFAGSASSQEVDVQAGQDLLWLPPVMQEISDPFGV